MYAIRKKSHVIKMFRNYIAYVRNHRQENLVEFEVESRKLFDELQSDHGGEYVSHELQDLLKENGILFKSTPRNTPELNGMAERYHQSLLNVVRCMLSQSGLPKIFWVEAITLAAYILNRIPNIDGNIPYQLWFNN